MLKNGWRHVKEAAVVSAVLVATSCGSNVERVPVVAYTEGVETELTEVAPNDWRIADERVLADSNDTRVIARGLDGISDTFTLAEVQATTTPAASDTTSQRRYRRRSGFSTILLYGLIGNRMGGYRSGITPRPNAYVNQSTYSRVQNSAGTRLNSTGRTTSFAPKGGRSGYGSKSSGARSGRSYGG